jgi:hypothetical protein
VNKAVLLIPAAVIAVVVLIIGLHFQCSSEGDHRVAESPAVKAEGGSKAGANGKLGSGRLRMTRQYIVIDRYANRLFLRTDDSVFLAADCSTGSGAQLTDAATGRHWTFDTPAGVFQVSSKLEGPWWRKPDWAFIEEGEKVPLTDEERMDPSMMGEYAIGFGNGYFIHGTLYERLLGVSVTHGCVRLGAEDLRKLYAHAQMGTYIFVY